MPITPTLLNTQELIHGQYDGRDGVSMTDVLRHWWSLDGARPGKPWQYWLGTVVYNTAFGTILSLMFYGFNTRAGWWNTWLETVWISQCIGLSIHALFELFHRLLAAQIVRWTKPIQHIAAGAVALSGIAVGYTIAFGVVGRNFWGMILASPRFAISMLILGIGGCVFWLLIMDGQTRRMRAEADELRTKEAEAALKRQASEAELRALQAQIEPHFLFNTLANVQALIDYEPEKAKRMLEAFIDYLRNTLDASRHSTATLGDELHLLQRYLDVMQVRMGERLRYTIAVPDDLRQVRFAPLLLQPLVENAIKYGLEPKIEGGEVRIEAERVQTPEGDAVRIRVIDDGVGLQAASTAKRRPGASVSAAGSGTGMANVRGRLQTLFGANATLSIASNHVNTVAVVQFVA
jgi:signal transduction histidine kinase